MHFGVPVKQFICVFLTKFLQKKKFFAPVHVNAKLQMKCDPRKPNNKKGLIDNARKFRHSNVPFIAILSHAS